MVMGQHDESRAGRRLAHHPRHRRQPRLDTVRHAFQRLGARLDDDDTHRQQASAAASAWPTWPPPKT